jgi:hypothetical protein
MTHHEPVTAATHAVDNVLDTPDHAPLFNGLPRAFDATSAPGEAQPGPGYRPFNNWPEARALGLPMAVLGLAVGALTPYLQTKLASALLGVEFPYSLTVGALSFAIVGLLLTAGLCVSRLTRRLVTVSGSPLLALWVGFGLAVWLGAAIPSLILPLYYWPFDLADVDVLVNFIGRVLASTSPLFAMATLIGSIFSTVARCWYGYPCHRDYLPVEAPALDTDPTAPERPARDMKSGQNPLAA